MTRDPQSKERLHCPNCDNGGGTVFYEVESVPTHSVLIFKSASEARAFQKGDIALAHCQSCDFIWNSRFDPALESYGLGYEATQAYSETFNTFHDTLARHVIERFDLKNKKVIEIGCGQGEFISLLCDLGDNVGIGFDPAFDATRQDTNRSAKASFIADFYSEKYNDETADLYCCKMTLEHIPTTLLFMENIRRAIGGKRDASIFFMIPNADYVLDEKAFWDVYYEHCSYFTPHALTCLMERAGFAVSEIYPAYDRQYLVVEAGMGPAENSQGLSTPRHSRDRVVSFGRDVKNFRDSWAAKLEATARKGRTTVLWGGGSKAVSFLTTVSTEDMVAAAVDINPHKRGTYLPGTGHPVIGPDDLETLNPDLVIVMNPIYMEEIRAELSARNLAPEILPITEYLPTIEAVAS